MSIKEERMNERRKKHELNVRRVNDKNETFAHVVDLFVCNFLQMHTSFANFICVILVLSCRCVSQELYPTLATITCPSL